MKHTFKIILFAILLSSGIHAQHRGNYNMVQEDISRANIATGGNAIVYSPAVNNTVNKVLNPNNYLEIDLKGLQNVKATSFTAIFNISQIGATAQETNDLVKSRVDAVKNVLASHGIKEDDMVIDVISFVPVFETLVEKKLFSTKYNEVPRGFELQQNIHIRFTKTSQFEHILAACAKNEIYNLVKVDYYIDNIGEIYINLQDKLLIAVEEKKAYYTALGFDMDDYMVAMADDKYCYFPRNFYKNYQAFNSISFDVMAKDKNITEIKKPVSYYYEPLSYGDYDVVVNGAILEPVIQVGMHLKLLYTKKPKEAKPEPVVKTEIKNKYFVIAPDGKIDIKELQTN